MPGDLAQICRAQVQYSHKFRVDGGDAAERYWVFDQHGRDLDPYEEMVSRRWTRPISVMMTVVLGVVGMLSLWSLVVVVVYLVFALDPMEEL